MRCADIQEWLSEYWDWPNDDIRKHQVNHHINTCETCRDEFSMWKESAALIKGYSDVQSIATPQTKTSASVMSRIYADDTWRQPIQHRSLNISYKMRKAVSLMMSFFLALFVVSLFYALSGNEPEETVQDWMPVAPVAHTVHGTLLDVNDDASVLQGVPIASISDPLVLRVSIVNQDPNYWVALSMLGIVSILLAMTWLSRVRY